MALPLVAVGLLYHQSRFTQTLDASGKQLSRRVQESFDNLPIAPIKNDSGNEVRVSIMIADRQVQLRLWRAQARRLVGRGL